MTNYSRSVLKSNGLRHSKNHPVKFSFSLKIVPATIAKKLPPQRCFKPLLIPIFNFSHKRPTFAFTSESGYTLGFRRKIAHSGSHGETGGHLCVVARSIWLPPHHSKNSRRKWMHANGVRPLPPAPRPRWAVGTYSFVTAWPFLHRYQSANSWNFRSRLSDVPTSIAKPSVFCYNILKSR